MKVSYNFERRGWQTEFEAPDEWPTDPVAMAPWVVGHYIASGRPWTGGVCINVVETPDGFEFDAEGPHQHFVVRCETQGPW